MTKQAFVPTQRSSIFWQTGHTFALRFRMATFLLMLMCPVLATSAPPLSELIKRPTMDRIKVSPDGNLIALRTLVNGQHTLRIVSRADNKLVGGLDLNLGMGKSQVGDYWWVNNERLVGTVLQTRSNEEQPGYYGELFATNFDGTDSELIFGFRSGERQTGSHIRKKKQDLAWAFFESTYPSDPRKILIAKKGFSKQQNKIPVAVLLDVYTGLESNTLARGTYPITDFFVDNNDTIRMVASVDDNDNRHVQYRESANTDWVDFPLGSIGDSFQPLALAEDEKLYALNNYDSNTLGLFKLSIDKRIAERVYVNDHVDIDGFLTTVDGRSIYALRLYNGYPSYILLDTAAPERAILKSLLSHFPGQVIDVISESNDGRYWTVRVSSDVNPGKYYLFDQQRNGVSLLVRQYPGIAAEELSPMKPISFLSSDGRRIHGYFTRAMNTESEFAPTLVLLHGGPHSRDYWGYDPVVQGFATRGINVLQINFRGSTGYGREHRNAGNMQWGGMIQQDIIAGTQWAIENGHAKQGKICIGGVSFGAYSAMMSATLKPDLYECVVAVSGVYDLPLLYKSGDIRQLYGGRNFLRSLIGEDQQQLAAYSPVNHVNKLQASVFLVHGKKDQRAPFQHAQRLRKALKKNKIEFEELIDKREAHGFSNQYNQLELLERSIDFVRRHTL